MEILVDSLRKNNKYTFEKKGNYHLIFLIDDGKDRDFDLKIETVQSDIFIYVTGLVIGFNDGKINISASVRHNAKKTFSKLEVGTILFDKADFNFNGLIRMEKEAVSGDAYMLNRNLLLSRQARVYCSPALEILTDDVKCSHGVVTDGIDERQLFYLRSRGLTYDRSVRIIVEGFAGGFIDKIGDNKIRNIIRKRISGRISKLFTKEVAI